jgi:hypothetical protein
VQRMNKRKDMAIPTIKEGTTMDDETRELQP